MKQNNARILWNLTLGMFGGGHHADRMNIVSGAALFSDTPLLLQAVKDETTDADRSVASFLRTWADALESGNNPKDKNIKTTETPLVS
jgi:hypothetical protein